MLSTRRTIAAATEALAEMGKQQQDFVLEWSNVIRKSNAELAYQFVIQAPTAIKAMGLEKTRTWLLQALDTYDQEGLYPGAAILQGLDHYLDKLKKQQNAVTLQEARPVLLQFIRGLSGRFLDIKSGNQSTTDTEILLLPASIAQFDERQSNYRLYKAMAVQLWAQTWFGTFRRPSPEAPHLNQRLAEFQDHGRALRLFCILENFRLSACIARELPGLSRETKLLCPSPSITDETWLSIIRGLELKDASVEQTLSGVATLYRLSTPWPDELPYQGNLDVDGAAKAINQRLNDERQLLEDAIRQQRQSLQDAVTDEQGQDSSEEEGLASEQGEQSANKDHESDNFVGMSEEIDRLLSSIKQDIEQVPDDWLNQSQANQGNQSLTNETDYEATDTLLYYDEWDFRRQAYRKDWCWLREISTTPMYDDFVANTLDKYHLELHSIKKQFEILRGEDRLLKAQKNGDELDLDALICGLMDAQAGHEMSDRVYSQKHRVERNLAVSLMVDISGSTRGWINEVERESLVLLCEALEVLGDKYAIHAFSGMTRKRCDLYHVKRFEDAYNDDVKARISGLRPQDYTRMGVIIRHLTAELNATQARTRLLITLSDGKPDDYDGYRGEYGIFDTRQALLEARNSGIHPFCITIDQEAASYLPQLYGSANYVVVNDIKNLPTKVAEIYRQITS